jgi:phage baseplate assembly protein W
MITNNRYRDIDFNFEKHPVTKDVPVKVNNEAIKQSLRNLMMLNYGEIPFSPTKGSNIQRLLFEPISSITAIQLRNEIEQMIRNYEPRIEISQVKIIADNDNYTYSCIIIYFIQNIEQPIEFNFILKRLR